MQHSSESSDTLPMTDSTRAVKKWGTGGFGGGQRGGGSSGKGKVFGSSGEKRRRYVVSDSESEDYAASPPPPPSRKASIGADWDRGDPVVMPKKQHGVLIRHKPAIGVPAGRVGGFDARKCYEVEASESRKFRMEQKRTADGFPRHDGGSDGTVKRVKIKPPKQDGYDSRELHLKKMKTGLLRPEVEKTMIRGDRDLYSERAIASSRDRDSFREKLMHMAVEDSYYPEAQRKSMLGQSGSAMHRMAEDRRHRMVNLDKDPSGISSGDKVIRVQGRGGVLKLLPTHKVGGFGKHPTRREEKGHKNHYMAGTSDTIISKKTSFFRETKPCDAAAPSFVSPKSHVDQKKRSHAIEIKSMEEKKETKHLSPKKEKPKNTNCVTDKIDYNSTIKASDSTRKSAGSQKTNRSTEKQKVREQIKTMLLSSGWKIELRPRRNRDYEDAVYVSPQGTGYWSITKAYTAFQEQLQVADEGGPSKVEELSGKNNNFDLNDPASAFSAISIDALNILKRNVVNKRKSKKNLQEGNDMPSDWSRSRKIKETISLKSSMNGYKSVASSDKRLLSASEGHLPLKRKKKNRRGCALLARNTSQGPDSDADDYIPYLGKRTILAWMIDSETLPANGKVKYMNKRQSRTMLEGWITRDGIHCSCCSKILPVSKFEVHAGSKLRQPYQNIFVEESGLSLLRCQLDAWENQEESKRRGFYSINTDGDDPNDDTCGICGDGGDLICCDGCPSTFHLSCLDIQMLPPGDWHCSNCTCKFCGLADSSNSHGDSFLAELLSCNQCEAKYHMGCVPDSDRTASDPSDISSSFCGSSCQELLRGLHRLLGIKNELESGFSWSLVQRLDVNSKTSPLDFDERAERNAKVAVALAVMDECFLPIVDQRSGINLIHNIVYNCGSNFNRLNYRGFYTFVLERGDEIIAAASVRIHGTRLAEMPFIGTRSMYRHQGMCRRLLNAIEMTLSSLNIVKLVIPAISELTHTWTTVFGFKPLDDSLRLEIKSRNMLVFPGTGLLEKTLLEQQEGAAGASGENLCKEGKTETNGHVIPLVEDGSKTHFTSGSDYASGNGKRCLLETKDKILPSALKRCPSPTESESLPSKPRFHTSDGITCGTSDMKCNATEVTHGSDFHASNRQLPNTPIVAQRCHSNFAYAKPEPESKDLDDSSADSAAKSPGENASQNEQAVVEDAAAKQCTSENVTMRAGAADFSGAGLCGNAKSMTPISLISATEKSSTASSINNNSTASSEGMVENEDVAIAPSQSAEPGNYERHTCEGIVNDVANKGRDTHTEPYLVRRPEGSHEIACGVSASKCSMPGEDFEVHNSVSVDKLMESANGKDTSH